MWSHNPVAIGGGWVRGRGSWCHKTSSLRCDCDWNLVSVVHIRFIISILDFPSGSEILISCVLFALQTYVTSSLGFKSCISNIVCTWMGMTFQQKCGEVPSNSKVIVWIWKPIFSCSVLQPCVQVFSASMLGRRTNIGWYLFYLTE